MRKFRIAINRIHPHPRDTIVLTGGAMQWLNSEEAEQLGTMVRTFIETCVAKKKPLVYYESILVLKLPIRVRNALMAANITMVQELVNHTPESLATLPQIAKGAIKAIEEALTAYELKLS